MGTYTEGRREKRERDQPRCVSLQLLNLSFLPLKRSQDNSWHVGSTFSISSQSLVLGALLLHGVAVPVQGCSSGGGTHTHTFSSFRLAEVGAWQVIISMANCCHPSWVCTAFPSLHVCPLHVHPQLCFHPTGDQTDLQTANTRLQGRNGGC